MKIPIAESHRTFWILLGIRAVIGLPLVGLTLYVGLQGIGWNPYSGENLLHFVRIAWITTFPALAASGILGNIPLGLVAELILTYSIAILIYSVKERRKTKVKHHGNQTQPTI